MNVQFRYQCIAYLVGQCYTEVLLIVCFEIPHNRQHQNEVHKEFYDSLTKATTQRAFPFVFVGDTLVGDYIGMVVTFKTGLFYMLMQG